MIRESSGLLTDLHELTMAAGYWQSRFDAIVSFELSVRDLPPHRNYLIAAGLEQCLEFLENPRFSPDDVACLRRDPAFQHIHDSFFNYLADFRFSGDVWAMPEGTLAFSDEPLLRVTSPIIQAQIVETFLLATVGYQTMVASKAARLVIAARGRPMIDFSASHAHGAGAALYAARAAVIGGCHGTSNVFAGLVFGIPTHGTQSHSWIMAHDDEADAFRQFLDVFPEHSILVVDTYNVRDAIAKILKIGRKPAGIRLGSGNMEAESRWIRREFDRVGWTDVKIFISGDLDEAKISSMAEHRAPVDAFGVGAQLGTPADAPHLNLIYKLVEGEREHEAVEAAKLSEVKIRYPGCKQVYRLRRPNGELRGDVIALADETSPGGEPLLVPVMRGGKRLHPPAPLSECRAHCLAGLALLPERFRQLARRAAYPVAHSAKLLATREGVRARVSQESPDEAAQPSEKRSKRRAHPTRRR